VPSPVLGGEPAGSPDALNRIAFVAQDAPLYKNLSAADMLHLARNLNRRWDQQYAETRLDDLGIPLTKKAGLPAGEPVLALPAHRGWLAARAGLAARRGDRVAGPPARGVTRR
jgi:hypothetical protein